MNKDYSELSAKHTILVALLKSGAISKVEYFDRIEKLRSK